MERNEFGLQGDAPSIIRGRMVVKGITFLAAACLSALTLSFRCELVKGRGEGSPFQSRYNSREVGDGANKTQQWSWGGHLPYGSKRALSVEERP